MKKIKALSVMKYLSALNVIGILAMLILRLDYPHNADDINWTPLYIPFCYKIEPVFGLWTSYLVVIVPLLVTIALWRSGIKYKLFLQAMFRIEICKYTVVLLLRLYWAWADVYFIRIDYICVLISLLMIFALRKGLRELKEIKDLSKFTVWGGFLFISLAVVVPLIPMIQYNEGIPATNSHIYMQVKLDKPGVIAETKFRVVRYSPQNIKVSFYMYNLEPIDNARFAKKVISEGGIKVELLLNIYRVEEGGEELVYSDKIDGHHNLEWVDSVYFKEPDLEQGVYRAVLECVTASNEYDGLKAGFIMHKKSNYWKFYK